MTYLDYNATSPLRPQARAAMERALAVCGNPSSVHSAGRAARALIEQAREAVAAFVHARTQDVVFTSGGSEANALALSGAIYGAIDRDERITRLFVSAIEHDSVSANAAILAERVAGVRLERIPVTRDGVIDTEALRVMLREGRGRALVAAMAANNETGVIQPVARIAQLVREAKALLLVDAVQAAGKARIDFDADYLTLASHKLGGPQGAGALVIRADAPFAPMIAGGGQERGLRAGTENAAAIAGFGAAVVAAASDDTARIAELRDRFERGLLAAVPDCTIFGSAVPRLAGTSCFALPGIPAETALMALDLDGVCISSGAACSSGKVKPSHVLKAMGVADALAASALRVSFGWASTPADADTALESITRLCTRVRPRVAA